MKAYSIVVNNADNSAEVNMYGEVVMNRPTDFWTGEKKDGLYIVVAEFLKDIDKLKSKSNVVFHINSPGGDVFAGISIYNRMKQFSGKVITIVDGLAASAASVIAQGATKGMRKVCTGSLTMIHGASTMMYGYYNSVELEEMLKRVDAVDKSIAEIYTQCSGIEEDEIRTMIADTTWMTSKEAVANGFADEIVDVDMPVTMSLNKDKSLLTVNGIPMSVKGLFNLPDYIQVKDEVTAGSNPDVIEKEKIGGSKKGMTLDELKEKHPELYAQVRDDAVQEVKSEQQTVVDAAVEAEVKRMKEIDEIASKIADKNLVTNAKYGDEKMNAGELALAALRQQKDIGEKFLEESHEDFVDSGAKNVEPTPNQGTLSEKEQSDKDIADGAALIAGVKGVGV